MTVSPRTIRLSFLVALSSAAAFFIYSSLANPFKLNAPPVVSDLKAGLVGYYTMDGQDTNWKTQTMTDKSGAGNNGTITNMSTSTSPVPGVAGQAMKFDGSNDFINLNENINFRGQTDAFSISSWVKTTGTSNMSIVSKADDTNVQLRHTLNTNGKVTIMVGNAVDGGGQTVGTTVVNDGKWHHIAATVPSGLSSGILLYVDGRQETFSSGTGLIGTTLVSGRDTLIGARRQYSNTDLANLFNGSIDEVRVYNRALSASEVSELYNQGAKRLLKANTQDTSRLTSGLVGYWTMDGQNTNWNTNITSDLSGNSNNGTITNMSTSTSPVPGVAGQALKFDGTNDNINVPHSTSLNFSTKAITVSTWFKKKSLVGSSGFAGLVEKTSTSEWATGYGIYFQRSNNTINFFVTDYTLNKAYKSFTYQSDDDQWNHVVGTYDGSNVRIYVNNVQGTSDTYSSNITTNTNPLFIGAGNTGTTAPGYFYSGQIDETRIYNRVLSASEITELYNAGVKKFIKVNNPDTSRLTSGALSATILWTARTRTGERK